MERVLSGAGIGLRPEHAEEVLASDREIDWLEIVPEVWMVPGGQRRWLLRELARRWPIIPHSVSLSLGGPDPLDLELIALARNLVEEVRPAFWSDHIGFSRINGVITRTIIPLPLTLEAAEHVGGRARVCASELGVPLILENMACYARMPGSEMGEAEFIIRVLEISGCGLLLDLDNLYLNSVNHGFDPFSFLDQLPMEKVQQIHLSGHQPISCLPIPTVRSEGLLADTHHGPISDPVWKLYKHSLARAGRSVPALVEWDYALPPLPTLLEEADLARRVAADVLSMSAKVSA